MAERKSHPSHARKLGASSRQRGKPAGELKPWEAAGLTEGQHTFALTYLGNGFNGTRAFLRAFPRTQSYSAAGVGAHHLLKTPKMREFLNAKLEEVWKPLQMGGEQALGRIAQIATFDLRDLYDDQGRLKPVREWTDDIVGVVRSVQDGPYGLKVSLESPHAALRTILEQTGKLNTQGDGVDALADALRADLARHGQADQ